MLVSEAEPLTLAPHIMLLSRLAAQSGLPQPGHHFHLSAGITIKICQEAGWVFRSAQLSPAGRLRAPCNAQVCFYYSC